MKKNRIKITFALFFLLGSLSVCWGGERQFQLRFIDSATLKPIEVHKFLFIPRVIEEKRFVASNAPNPNLKFSKSVTTDPQGTCTLSETFVQELTQKGKVYVDVQSETFTTFVFRASTSGGQDFTITTFHKGWPSSRVATLIYISEQHVNSLLLEQKELKK